MPGKEHAVILYLNPQMRLGTIKVQSFMELGQSYAALIIYNEGLKALGQINEADYQLNKKKYSKKLVEQPIKQLTRDEQKKIEQQQQAGRTFQLVLQDWNNPIRTQQWRDDWLIRAEKAMGEIPEAEMLVRTVLGRAFVK